MRLFLGVAVAFSLSFASLAQQPSLKDVIARLDRYLLQYEQALASVVAEERYSQTTFLGVYESQRRVLLSDYALARSPGGQTWTGYRDTFEVDGKPVREREARLASLLASGTPESSAQARRIAVLNARYNIGQEVAVRNVNVPTMVLDLMRPINRSRFSLSRSGGDTIDGRATWRLAFKERERPTIIRDLDGRDRRASGSIWLDPLTGDVMKTTLEWEGEPDGSITVTYQRDLNIGALVPVRMIEEYRRGLRMEGEATYTNYRRFQTSARIVP
jgi:hypothetical protein